MPLQMTKSRTSGGLRFLALLCAVSVPLAGCSSSVDRAVALSPIPADYHARHPIVLAEAPRRLDIFFVGANGRLDVAQDRQLQDFARDFGVEGQGVIHIGVPQGSRDTYTAERTLSAVRRSLQRAGFHDRVTVSGYPVGDPAIASPLHLSYVTLQARPTTRCGDWPDDLGSGATLNSWENRSYYNLGCASQQTLAAQVANPRDLVQPRAEDPTDVQLRTRAIQLLRGAPTANKGSDPTTPWTRTNEPSRIGPVGEF